MEALIDEIISNLDYDNMDYDVLRDDRVTILRVFTETGTVKITIEEE